MRRLLKKYPLGYEGYLKERQININAAANAANFAKNAEVEAAVTETSLGALKGLNVPVGANIRATASE